LLSRGKWRCADGWARRRGGGEESGCCDPTRYVTRLSFLPFLSSAHLQILTSPWPPSTSTPSSRPSRRAPPRPRAPCIRARPPRRRFFDAGLVAGRAHGRIHGLIEGRALGRAKGFELWEELGFYAGYARAARALGAQEECVRRA
jgi:hypothetical protein